MVVVLDCTMRESVVGAEASGATARARAASSVSLAVARTIDRLALDYSALYLQNTCVIVLRYQSGVGGIGCRP